LSAALAWRCLHQTTMSKDPSHATLALLPDAGTPTGGLEASSLDACQLRWIDDAVEDLNRLERLGRFVNAKRLGAIRRTRAALSRVTAVRPEPYGGTATWVERADGTAVPLAPRKIILKGLKAGDLVEILSAEEIARTLDAERKTGGLKFMKPMESYCGRRMRVLKPVRRILDEHDHMMRKVSRTVVLDGGICHGRGVYGREGCDRCCYFFWKEDWLRKVGE
jgi:hypothetical protein